MEKFGNEKPGGIFFESQVCLNNIIGLLNDLENSQILRPPCLISMSHFSGVGIINNAYLVAIKFPRMFQMSQQPRGFETRTTAATFAKRLSGV